VHGRKENGKRIRKGKKKKRIETLEEINNIEQGITTGKQ
jgi:hypothetical protein